MLLAAATGETNLEGHCLYSSLVGRRSTPEGFVVPPDTIVMGVPAKPMREVTPEERERFETNAAHYVSEAAEYAKGHPK